MREHFDRKKGQQADSCVEKYMFISTRWIDRGAREQKMFKRMG
jgi:hypothetical protein